MSFEQPQLFFNIYFCFHCYKTNKQKHEEILEDKHNQVQVILQNFSCLNSFCHLSDIKEQHKFLRLPELMNTCTFS